MKEWLLKTENGKYHYYRDDMDCCPKYVEKIEIPEGAELFVFWPYNNDYNFHAEKSYFEDGKWNMCAWSVHQIRLGEAGADLLWDRKVHQKIFTDESEIVNEEMKLLNSKKHHHYFKDVSNLLELDVYRVLKLFDVTDPCIQHAVKKLLCAGGRGVKDVDKDVHEAIDSLLRYEEMRREDEADS
ncbi:hypothetical protein Scipio_00074 [Acinetobacter phage Scipio]|nr:hypothetical protein Scipio_00074 [Acinetobacter phage Scipio]